MHCGFTKWLPAAAAVLALVLTSPAWAQREGQQDRQRQQRAGQMRAERQERPRMQDQQRGKQQAVRLTGEIVRVKRVAIRGTDRTHVVVQLRTKQGQQKIVDLGLQRNLRDLNLKKGKQITVVGRPVSIGDYRIVLARRVKADDQVATTRHARPQPSEKRMEGERRTARPPHQERMRQR